MSQGVTGVRYYLYVSEAKLDMLFEQIPQKLLSRLATEAKVDLKVVSVAVQKAARAEPGTYGRLDVVERYLEREYDIGWMTEPTSWFRGDLGLRIAGYGSATGPVFMTGQEGRTVVALIGSAHHLVGHRVQAEGIPVGHSMLPSLFRLLRETPEDWPRREPTAVSGRDYPANDREALRQVLDFSAHLTEPATYCEFLARRLLRGTATDENGQEWEVVIGTPLYVAMAEDEDDGAGGRR
ncbi:DUF7019 family protein [Streptomyces sp. NPDC058683]|uniref:DUF7019 family protein n=1 Tax=Streptomyces sp. NPDC058683 TaxID=3346597 RepID=UPI00366976F1